MIIHILFSHSFSSFMSHVISDPGAVPKKGTLVSGVPKQKKSNITLPP